MQISPEFWANIFSFILVIVTGVYVYLTWRLAKSNQKMLEQVEVQHQEEVRPNVYASIEFREQVFARLSIENKGKTPAYKLRISLDKDFYQFADTSKKNLRSMTVFNDIIDYFPPNAKITIDLAQGYNFERKLEDGRIITPSKFTVMCEYESRHETYSEACRIDLSPFMNTHVPKTEAEQLAEISKYLKKISES